MATAPPMMSDPEMPLLHLLAERYRIEKLLGTGGMARVYYAVDQRMNNRPVAVKVITSKMRADPQFDSRFRRETNILSSLDHANVITILDSGLDPEYGPYLVMRYLKGETLRERIKREGVVTPKVGFEIALQTLDALDHAHGCGVVHRDIKPDNLMLIGPPGDPRVNVQVLDFGIARIYINDAQMARNEQLTSTGAVLGAPRYMAPEQLAGQPVDHRADLYSLGVVVLEALQGSGALQSKFNTPRPTASGAGTGGHTTIATPSPSQSRVHPLLMDWIGRLRQVSPDKRFPTAAAARTALMELGTRISLLQPSDHPPPPPPPPPEPPPRRPWARRAAVALGVVAAVLLTVGLGLALAGALAPAPAPETGTAP